MKLPIRSFRVVMAGFAIWAIATSSGCFSKYGVAQQPPPTGVQGVRLRPGDNIEIRLGGVTSFEEINAVSGMRTIDSEGFLNLPFIGRIKAAGLTQHQLQETIEKKYIAQGVYTAPAITVAVPLSERFVSVGGEVRLPQRITYTPDLTLLAAIQAAGGFNEYASHSRVRLLRGNEARIVDVRKVIKNPGLDVPLEPGDVVEIPRSLF
jgi:protein involved in polysaccharide export with SLBB domain